jgi:hypothetical protein
VDRDRVGAATGIGSLIDERERVMDVSCRVMAHLGSHAFATRSGDG